MTNRTTIITALAILAAAVWSAVLVLPGSAEAEKMTVKPSRPVAICVDKSNGPGQEFFDLCSNLPIKWTEV